MWWTGSKRSRRISSNYSNWFIFDGVIKKIKMWPFKDTLLIGLFTQFSTRRSIDCYSTCIQYMQGLARTRVYAEILCAFHTSNDSVEHCVDRAFSVDLQRTTQTHWSSRRNDVPISAHLLPQRGAADDVTVQPTGLEVLCPSALTARLCMSTCRQTVKKNMTLTLTFDLTSGSVHA